MDPQHQQWRPRPPPCPICSISHFPFCPPHPPFHQNPNFPHDSGNSFQRPALDPYSRPIAPLPPWQRNPTFGYANFQGFPPPPPPPSSQPQPPPPPPPPPYDYNGYDNEGDRNFKRARIDDFGSGNAGCLSEDERRLKLIHDHGGAGLASGSNHSELVNNVKTDRSFLMKVNEPVNPNLKPHYSVNTIQRSPALRPISGQQPPLPVSPPPPFPPKPPPGVGASFIVSCSWWFLYRLSTES